MHGTRPTKSKRKHKTTGMLEERGIDEEGEERRRDVTICTERNELARWVGVMPRRERERDGEVRVNGKEKQRARE